MLYHGSHVRWYLRKRGAREGRLGRYIDMCKAFVYIYSNRKFEVIINQKIPVFRDTCATCSGFPSRISTMYVYIYPCLACLHFKVLTLEGVLPDIMATGLSGFLTRQLGVSGEHFGGRGIL